MYLEYANILFLFLPVVSFSIPSFTNLSIRAMVLGLIAWAHNCLNLLDWQQDVAPVGPHGQCRLKNRSENPEKIN